MIAPPKRTHVDGRIFTNRCRSFSPQEIRLADVDAQQDRAALLSIFDAWTDEKYRPVGLDEEDILAVALIQDLPFAFQVWQEAGASLNADSILALFYIENQSKVFNLADFLAPHLAPWLSVVFYWVLAQQREDLALSLLQNDILSISSLIPPTQNEAEGWLWWSSPLVKREDDSSLPLHVALSKHCWKVAQWLLDRGAPCDQLDKRDTLPVDALLQSRAYYPGCTAPRVKNEIQTWVDRLLVSQEKEVLDLSTPMVNHIAQPPKRL